MKYMVVCPSNPRKMLSFSTTKLDNVDVLCIDQPQRSWRLMQLLKVPNQRKIAKKLVSIANFTPTSDFSTTNIKGEMGIQMVNWDFTIVVDPLIESRFIPHSLKLCCPHPSHQTKVNTLASCLHGKISLFRLLLFHCF